MAKHRIGRSMGRGPLKPAFDIEWGDGGRLKVTNIDPVHGPNVAERRHILEHLAAKHTADSPPDTAHQFYHQRDL